MRSHDNCTPGWCTLLGGLAYCGGSAGALQAHPWVQCSAGTGSTQPPHAAAQGRYLVRHFWVKLHDHNHWELQVLAGGRHAGQQPIHGLCSGAQVPARAASRWVPSLATGVSG